MKVGGNKRSRDLNALNPLHGKAQDKAELPDTVLNIPMYLDLQGSFGRKAVFVSTLPAPRMLFLSQNSGPDCRFI